MIRLPGREHVVAELRRTNTVLSTCGRESLQSEEDDDGRFLNVSLPEFTEYLLDVFEPRPGGGLEHIQTYAIRRVAVADADNGDADSHETQNAASAAETNKPVIDDKEREKLAKKKALGVYCRIHQFYQRELCIRQYVSAKKVAYCLAKLSSSEQEPVSCLDHTKFCLKSCITINRNATFICLC